MRIWMLTIVMVSLVVQDASAFGRHRRHRRRGQESGCSSSTVISVTRPQPQILPPRAYEGQMEEIQPPLSAPSRTLEFGPTVVDRSTQPRSGETILIYRDGRFIETVYQGGK